MRQLFTRRALSVLFLFTGTMHFVNPGLFKAIIPPGFGDPSLDVALSGWAEIAGGVGILSPLLERYARFGLIALLIAVWPANWYMALQAQRFVHLAPAWALWARLPLQILLIAMIWRLNDPAQSSKTKF